MTLLRKSVEGTLARYGKLLVNHPRRVLCVTLAVIFSLMIGLSQLYTDVSNESLFKDTEQSLQDYRNFQDQFGRDDSVVAAVEVAGGYTPEFLQRLRNFQHDLEDNVVHLDLITSIESATSVTDVNNELLIGDLGDLWPKNKDEQFEFEQRLKTDPLIYERLVDSSLGTTLIIIQATTSSPISSESQSTTMESIADLHEKFRNWLNRGYEDQTIRKKNEVTEDEFALFNEQLSGTSADKGGVKERPLTTVELAVFVESIREVTKRHNTAEFPITLAGGQLIDHEHKESIHADMGRMIPIVFLLVLTVVFFLIRDLYLVIVPLGIISAASASTLGLMGWLGSPITPVAVALPPLLLTVGVSDSMHIINVYKNGFRSGLNSHEAIIYALKRSGTALFFTSVTTAAGFMAFVFADIQSVVAFGYFAAFGVIAAFVLTITLIPIAILLRKNVNIKVDNSTIINTINCQLIRFAKFSEINSTLVLFVLGLCCLIALPGVARLSFSHDVLTWFAPDSSIRVNTYKLDEKFVGLSPLEFVVDTEVENGVYEPEFIKKVNEFHEFSKGVGDDNVNVGVTSSVLDTLLAIDRAINSESENGLPDSRHLIAQELLLFESSGADDVSQTIDPKFSKIRVTVRLSWADALDYIPIRRDLEEGAHLIFSDDTVVSVTGTLDLVRRALTGVIQSMASSYMLAFTGIFIIMFALVGNFKRAAISMLPNIVPIFLILGLMGYANISITLFTVLLGGIAIGLVVDDTVHMIQGLRETGDKHNRSVAEVIREIGPALLSTTSAVSIGFLVFAFSTNIALIQFGLLLSLTVVVALVVDLALIPALFGNKKKDELELSETISGSVETADTKI